MYLLHNAHECTSILSKKEEITQQIYQNTFALITHSCLSLTAQTDGSGASKYKHQMKTEKPM